MTTPDTHLTPDQVEELWSMLAPAERVELVKAAQREREADLAIHEAHEAEKHSRTFIRKEIIRSLRDRCQKFEIGFHDDAHCRPIDLDIQVTSYGHFSVAWIPCVLWSIPLPVTKQGANGSFRIQQLGTTRIRDSLATHKIWAPGDPVNPDAPINDPASHFAQQEVCLSGFASVSMHRLTPDEMSEKITDVEILDSRTDFDASDDPRTLEEAPFHTTPEPRPKGSIEVDTH